MVKPMSRSGERTIYATTRDCFGLKLVTSSPLSEEQPPMAIRTSQSC